MWLLRWKQGWEGEGARSLPARPSCLSSWITWPFIPPPSPWDQKRCCLLSRPNPGYQCLSSANLLLLSLPHALGPAPYLLCGPSSKSCMFVTQIYSLSIHREWGLSQLKTIWMNMFCSICQFRTGQTWRMRDFWWEMMDYLFNLGFLAPFLMWRSGRLNAQNPWTKPASEANVQTCWFKGHQWDQLCFSMQLPGPKTLGMVKWCG